MQKTTRIGTTLGLAAIVAGAIWLALPDARADSSRPETNQAKAPPEQVSQFVRPVVDTHHLMELFNQPLFQLLKDTMQEEPQDDEAWKTIHERGLQAAELTNLIAIREAGHKRPGEWTEHARMVRKSGLALAEAGQQREWQAATTAYRNLVQSCNQCHSEFASGHAPVLKP